MNTDTPRTKTLCLSFIERRLPDIDRMAEMVVHAEKLERELAEALSCIQSLMRILTGADDTPSSDKHASVIEMIARGKRDEFAEAKEQAAQLAGALELLHQVSKDEDPPGDTVLIANSMAEEALAAWQAHGKEGA